MMDELENGEPIKASKALANAFENDTKFTLNYIANLANEAILREQGCKNHKQYLYQPHVLMFCIRFLTMIAQYDSNHNQYMPKDEYAKLIMVLHAYPVNSNTFDDTEKLFKDEKKKAKTLGVLEAKTDMTLSTTRALMDAKISTEIASNNNNNNQATVSTLVTNVAASPIFTRDVADNHSANDKSEMDKNASVTLLPTLKG